MQRIKKAIIVLFTVAMLAGCGGGSGSHDNNIAYLIGTPHGEMAEVLSNNIAMDPYDGKSTNRNIVIANPGGEPIDEQYKEGIRKSYKAGRTIIMEDATPTEINILLEILGLPPTYATKTNEAVALFAAEQIKGHAFFYAAANDNDADIDDLPAEPQAVACTTSDGTDAMDELQEGTKKTKSKNKKSLSPVTDALIQDGRMDRFMDWINDEDGRMEALKANKDEMQKEILKAGGVIDLKQYAEAASWDEDVSTNGMHFTINYTSYSCHSFEQDQDYYAIRQTANLNPSGAWVNRSAGNNCSTLATQYGYMRNYTFRNYWASNPGVNAPIRDHSPLNANNVTTVTSGIEFSVSGNVGFKGSSPTGDIGGGVTFQDSKSVNVQDVTVNDNTSATLPWEASWKYVFKDPDDGSRYFACSDLEDAPLLSRSNFSPVNQWVWVTSRKFRRQDGKQSFTSEFGWTSGISYGSENAWWVTVTKSKHNDYNNRSVSMNIPLQQPPLLMTNTNQIDFTKSGESKAFTIVSAVPWTASCSQPWCVIETSSGSGTGASGQVVHITAKENTDNANRNAVITINSTSSSDVAQIKIFQSEF